MQRSIGIQYGYRSHLEVYVIHNRGYQLFFLESLTPSPFTDAQIMINKLLTTLKYNQTIVLFYFHIYFEALVHSLKWS